MRVLLAIHHPISDELKVESRKKDRLGLKDAELSALEYCAAEEFAMKEKLMTRVGFHTESLRVDKPNAEDY